MTHDHVRSAAPRERGPAPSMRVVGLVFYHAETKDRLGIEKVRLPRDGFGALFDAVHGRVGLFDDIKHRVQIVSPDAYWNAEAAQQMADRYANRPSATRPVFEPKTGKASSI